MTPLFAYSASGLAIVWLAVHFFMGGKQIAGPLRQNQDLPDVVRVTAWMCWHMVTACIALLATLPILALTLNLSGLMVAAVLLALALAVGGIASQIALKASFKLLPQGWLFIPVAILAGLAL